MALADPTTATGNGVADGASLRRTRILDLVAAAGFVTIDGLAAGLGVSSQTVRRDLIALDADGLVQRFHGGAGRGQASQAVRLGHSSRRGVDAGEKARVGVRAAALVPDGAWVYLDVGTTVEAAAGILAARPGLTVITNSIRVAALFDWRRTGVHVLPGTLAGGDGSLVGEGAGRALRAMRLDVAMIGCSGIEANGAVMDHDPGKVAIKRAAIAVAKRSLLLATASKFGRTARFEIAHRTVFEVVTDGPPGATARDDGETGRGTG